MCNSPSLGKTALLLAVLCFFVGSGFSQTATLQNPGFETYIAASDSFAGWSFEKDSTGGENYVISQETDSAHTGSGALKMEITGADTSIECSISGSISDLPANKNFTITAWVKYSDIPNYWNGMFHLQQAILEGPDWEWINRPWLSMWGNNPGSTPWKQISMSDVSDDSANVFNLIISLSNAGTMWVDSIAITYTDVPVVQKAFTSPQRGAIRNNRITFSSIMPYSLEVCGLNGKLILRKSGIAKTIDLNGLAAGSGVYLVRVETAKKTFASRVVLSK